MPTSTNDTNPISWIKVRYITRVCYSWCYCRGVMRLLALSIYIGACVIQLGRQKFYVFSLFSTLFFMRSTRRFKGDLCKCRLHTHTHTHKHKNVLPDIHRAHVIGVYGRHRSSDKNRGLVYNILLCAYLLYCDNESASVQQPFRGPITPLYVVQV